VAIALTAADKIWNRACDRGRLGGGAGDLHLAAFLLADGLIQNGGVHHAVEVLGEAGLAQALSAARYFGFHDFPALINGVLADASQPQDLSAREREVDTDYYRRFPTERVWASFLDRLENAPDDFDPPPA
jgi:hypothetical protein